MRGLIRKEFSLLKTNGLVYLVVIALFSFLTVSGNGNFSAMIVMMTTMLALNTFTYDDLARWNLYCLALPVSRKTVVQSKYLLTLLLWAVGMAFSWLLVAIAPGSDGTVTAAFLPSLLIGSALLVAFAITMPFLFKLGVEKARLIMMLAVAVPLLIAVGLMTIWDEQAASPLAALSVAMAVIALALLAVSYFFSVRILERKDI